MELLKSLWAKWRVHVSVVGGVLVVATAYGTCSVDPEAVSTSATGTTDTVEVSATTTTTQLEPRPLQLRQSSAKAAGRPVKSLPHFKTFTRGGNNEVYLTDLCCNGA